MKLPLQTTIRDIPHSPVLENHIYAKAEKLNQFCDRIMGCRVVLEAPQKHQHQGKLYNVRIDITVPGEELAITRNKNEDIYVALRNAFDDAKRQLENYSARQQNHGKVHTNHKVPLHGHITRLFPQQGYGFIETWDGHEVYFHRCSILSTPFDHLTLGAEVQFLEERGEKGPQATRVKVRRTHH